MNDLPGDPSLPPGVTMRDIDGPSGRVPCDCGTKLCAGCDERKCREHDGGSECEECEEFFCGECEEDCLRHYDCRYLCELCRDLYR